MDPERGLCKLWDTDGSLRLCFDNITEYDPDVVFDKCDFVAQNIADFMKPTYIQVLIKNDA